MEIYKFGCIKFVYVECILNLMENDYEGRTQSGNTVMAHTYDPDLLKQPLHEMKVTESISTLGAQEVTLIAERSKCYPRKRRRSSFTGTRKHRVLWNTGSTLTDCSKESTPESATKKNVVEMNATKHGQCSHHRVDYPEFRSTEVSQQEHSRSPREVPRLFTSTRQSPRSCTRFIQSFEEFINKTVEQVKRGEITGLLSRKKQKSFVETIKESMMHEESDEVAHRKDIHLESRRVEIAEICSLIASRMGIASDTLAIQIVEQTRIGYSSSELHPKDYPATSSSRNLGSRIGKRTSLLLCKMRATEKCHIIHPGPDFPDCSSNFESIVLHLLEHIDGYIATSKKELRKTAKASHTRALELSVEAWCIMFLFVDLSSALCTEEGRIAEYTEKALISAGRIFRAFAHVVDNVIRLDLPDKGFCVHRLVSSYTFDEIILPQSALRVPYRILSDCVAIGFHRPLQPETMREVWNKLKNGIQSIHDPGRRHKMEKDFEDETLRFQRIAPTQRVFPDPTFKHAGGNLSNLSSILQAKSKKSVTRHISQQSSECGDYFNRGCDPSGDDHGYVYSTSGSTKLNLDRQRWVLKMYEPDVEGNWGSRYMHRVIPGSSDYSPVRNPSRNCMLEGVSNDSGQTSGESELYPNSVLLLPPETPSQLRV